LADHIRVPLWLITSFDPFPHPRADFAKWFDPGFVESRGDDRATLTFLGPLENLADDLRNLGV
jgi:hypothetical protein